MGTATDDEKTGQDPDTTVAWLIRDRGDGLYMTKSGTWRNYARAGSWPSAEDATRALLGVSLERFETVDLVEEIRSRRPAIAASEALPPPSNVGSIPASWIAATGTMNARHLLNTMRMVQARAVDPRNIPAVMEIHEEVTGRRPFGMS